MKSVSNAVDYIESSGQWKEALYLLRSIFLSSGLEETIKWGGPVYTHNGKNLAAMAAFRSYAGIWFYQGALLKDEAGKLINAQEGVTKALRQWRFASFGQVVAEEELIRSYIYESIENYGENREIKPDRRTTLHLPALLEAALEADQQLKTCFESFTPGNRKDFCDYLEQAKLEKTKQQRLQKIIPMICRGEGLNDRYKRK